MKIALKFSLAPQLSTFSVTFKDHSWLSTFLRILGIVQYGLTEDINPIHFSFVDRQNQLLPFSFAQSHRIVGSPVLPVHFNYATSPSIILLTGLPTTRALRTKPICSIARGIPELSSILLHSTILFSSSTFYSPTNLMDTNISEGFLLFGLSIS